WQVYPPPWHGWTVRHWSSFVRGPSLATCWRRSPTGSIDPSRAKGGGIFRSPSVPSSCSLDDSMTEPFTSIAALPEHVGETVTLKGRLYNKRGSKGLYFLVLRDGSGLVQCVVNAEQVDADSFQAADEVTQESALEVVGAVRADERQVGGVEVHASQVRLISLAEPYPITPKEHGIEFLMDRRHLWLRSRRQWAVMRVRNRIIMAIHGYF